MRTLPQRLAAPERIPGGEPVPGRCGRALLTLAAGILTGMSARRYRIVTVCWGNICRSPMAQFVLRAALEEAGLGGRAEVISAGTSAEELGNRMDRRALATLRRNGVPDTGFDQHIARRFTASWFDEADLVLAADHIHYRILLGLARDEDEAASVVLLRSFDPQAVAEGDLGMADPWYGGQEDFDLTYEQVRRAAPGVVGYVRARLS